ncbi:23293_t:CDS:2, partial [Dentiscutata erythropus]
MFTFKPVFYIRFQVAGRVKSFIQDCGFFIWDVHIQTDLLSRF